MGDFLHINLHKFHSALIFIRQLITEKTRWVAGMAPFGGEASEHREFTSQHFLIKISFVNLNHRTILFSAT